MITHGPFSTSTGPSPVPYLTAAFAGNGNFTVSPILGYQKGGLNSDGTPDTTSRQFQAGLSVTGKGAAQNATLFVMTSAISNAPNIGFTQAGGFTGVTVRNGAGWYGLATGAVSSATQNSAHNTVQTLNGLPVAGFSLNSSTTNLNTGSVLDTQAFNYLQTGPANYRFDPVTTQAVDGPGEQPSDPDPEWLCRRSDGDRDRRGAGRANEFHEALCRNQYRE